MANLYYDNAADISLIQAKKVAISATVRRVHAHALNLRDSGVSVRVGLHEAVPRVLKQKRQADRQHTAEAAAWADVIMILVRTPSSRSYIATPSSQISSRKS